MNKKTPLNAVIGRGRLICNNIGEDIPIDVPPNQNIGGDVSPASSVALTPVQLRATEAPTPCFHYFVGPALSASLQCTPSRYTAYT